MQRNNHLKRIMELVSRTGDRVVVIDPAFPEPFVLMDIGNYELLADALADVGNFAQAEELSDENSSIFGSTEQKIEPIFNPLANDLGGSAPDLTQNSGSDILQPATDSVPQYVPLERPVQQEAVYPPVNPEPPLEAFKESEAAQPIPQLGAEEASGAGEAGTEFLPEPEA